jgi:fatty acid desaturase
VGPASLVLVPLQGFLIASLFAPLHESVHLTVFRTRWLNTALGWPCALALGFVPTGYRYLHYEHHRRSNEWDDPELKGRSIEWPRSIEEYVSRMVAPAFPGLFLKVPMIARLAAGPSLLDWESRPYVPAEKRRVIVREARVCLLAYLALGALCVWRWPVALATVVPAFIGQVVLAAYLFPEHTGCDPQGSMLERTRTTYTNGLVRFFFWNMPYHAEHHHDPGVPFHALPRLHQSVEPELVHVARSGYLAFHLAVLRGVTREPDA